jgi:hypothetical protein
MSSAAAIGTAACTGGMTITNHATQAPNRTCLCAFTSPPRMRCGQATLGGQPITETATGSARFRLASLPVRARHEYVSAIVPEGLGEPSAAEHQRVVSPQQNRPG